MTPTTRRIFPAPEPWRPKPRIHPVFIPFQGCRVRCVFCAQTLQTGKTARAVKDILADLTDALETMSLEGLPPREIAFYGGTFTALPEAEQFAFLELARAYREKGIITKIRASTRPDAVTPGHLAALRQAGLDMLELGVQSFCDAPLAASSRGYGGAQAREGCAFVRESGLQLGIQLMPGMPGMNAGDFSRDLEQTVATAPAAVRLYPCLVLAGTELAAHYASGKFAPWPLDKTIPLLVEAQLAFWRADIPVIRMGLAPQDSLDDGGILAGPAHPALGSLVRGLALCRYIKKELARLGAPASNATRPDGPAASDIRLTLPRRFQGEFWGHGKSLEADYAAMGVRRGMVAWHDAEYCEAEF